MYMKQNSITALAKATFKRDSLSCLIPLLRTQSRELESWNLGDMEQITRRIEFKDPTMKPTVGK